MRFNIKMTIIFLLLCVLMGLLVCTFSSCEILKHKKSETLDSTRIIKTVVAIKDTTSAGVVSKEKTTEKEANEWWRVIQQFQPHGGDTTIVYNNHYPQPATVIYEGGKGSREATAERTDSAWINSVMTMVATSLDSMNKKLTTIEKDKKSETKGVGLLTVLLLGVGFVLLNYLLGFVGSNYSIVKKQK